MRTLRACVVGMLLIALAGCESGREKEVIGTLVGAAAGILIGSQIGSGSGQAAAMGFGALLGGMIGGAVGERLDQRDRERAQEAARESLHKTPDGSSSTWLNPDSGNSGSVFERNRSRVGEDDVVIPRANCSVCPRRRTRRELPADPLWIEHWIRSGCTSSTTR